MFSSVYATEMFWTEWLTYGITGVVAVVCLGSIGRAIFVPSDVRRQCCCGGCGYAIADPPPARCPECGGQLTKVGISTPAMAVRLRGGLGWALLAWTAICGMAGQLAWGYVQQSAWSAATIAASAGSAFNGKMQYSGNTTYSPQKFGFGMRDSSLEPDDLNYRIDSTDSYVMDGSAVESGTATFTLRKNGTDSMATMELDLAAQTFVLKDAQDTVLRKGKSSEVDDSVIKAWFDAAGVAVKSEAAIRGYADTKRLLKASFDDPQGVQSMFQMGGGGQLGGLSSSGGGSSSGPVGGGIGPMGMPSPVYWNTKSQLLGGILGAVYLLGLAGIWWRRRRLLA